MGDDGEERQVVVPEGVRRDRADKVLALLYPEISRSRWQKLFQEGRIWSDDRALSQKDKIRAGDFIQYSIPAAFPAEIRPVPMELVVLYEDASILVLDKQPGQVVHPGAGTREDTLVHGLLHHCQGSLSGIGGVERPGIVHRLDKETSGVLVIAKTDAAHQSLSMQFADRQVRKYYQALLTGVPDPPSGSVDEPIGRHPVHRTRMACREDGRSAQTDYTCLRKFGSIASLVRLRIHTGRTHQIRVHMKHLGHPLLGDPLYGYKTSLTEGGQVQAQLIIPRVMLHAWRLEFIHPVSGQELSLEAPLPDDFSVTMGGLELIASERKSH